MLEFLQITLIAVSVLLLTAVPGYLLVKTKLIGEGAIPAFSKLLLYVASPCLVVYSFRSAEFSVEKLIDIGIFALITLAVHAVMLGCAVLVLRKKYKNTLYRIITVATTFANCAFFGIPILEAIFPNTASELIIYTTVYSQVMNTLGWTVASAVISGDTKYVSLRKMLLNPTTISTAIGLILFITGLPIYPDFENMINITGRMATPLSMIIMGMRLATVSFPRLFTDAKIYLTVGVKQLIMPLVTLAIVLFLPVNPEIKTALYVISACPVASVVLNYSELVGEGQREAANLVLLGTILSAVTLPVMMMLLPIFSL